MNISNEQLKAAINSGLVITDPASEVAVPLKHAGGVLILHQVLLAVAKGELTIVQAEGDIDPADLKPGGTNDDDD
jgi:hypothetical protein